MNNKSRTSYQVMGHLNRALVIEMVNDSKKRVKRERKEDGEQALAE